MTSQHSCKAPLSFHPEVLQTVRGSLSIPLINESYYSQTKQRHSLRRKQAFSATRALLYIRNVRSRVGTYRNIVVPSHEGVCLIQHVESYLREDEGFALC
jgi:hypothetical protein